MGFWNWLTGGTNHQGEQSNLNSPPPAPGTVGPTGYTPGSDDGFEVLPPDTPIEVRGFPVLSPSPWSGWPANWSTGWDGAGKFAELVDTAWTCLDKNSLVLSTMPVYKLRGQEVVEPESWMMNPDPRIYTSWHEFARQLFWDYQMGEAFVWATDYFSSGWPMFFRVLPVWAVKVEMEGSQRRYYVGSVEITADVLHIRYKSTTGDAHGHGPLEVAGARMVAASVLAKYAGEVVANGVPDYTLETDMELDDGEAEDLRNQWVNARTSNPGAPPVLDSNVSLKTHQHMSPKDMALIEVAQFNDARIAVMLGMPPALVGLPSGDSVTYQNVQQAFDFHDRQALHPFATNVMSALSAWALPRGSTVELNRDEYTRPSFAERAAAWVQLIAAGAVSVDEFRAAERFSGEAPTAVAAVLTGGEVA